MTNKREPKMGIQNDKQAGTQNDQARTRNDELAAQLKMVNKRELKMTS